MECSDKKGEVTQMAKTLVAYFSASGFGNTVRDLQPSVDASTKFVSEKLLNGATMSEIENWVKSI